MYRFAAASKQEVIVYGSLDLNFRMKKCMIGLNICIVKRLSVFVVCYLKSNLHLMQTCLVLTNKNLDSQPYNHVYITTNELKGIAVWIPPGEYPLNDLRLVQLGLYALPFKLRLSRIRQLISLFLTLEKHHKQDLSQPHWYLFMLGVSPTYQSQGIGSLLLQPILNQADRERLPCYLETSTEGGVRFYQRLDFEVVRTGSLPQANFKFWTMMRSPQQEK